MLKYELVLYLLVSLMSTLYSDDLVVFGGVDDGRRIRSSAAARMEEYKEHLTKKASEIDTAMRYISVLEKHEPLKGVSESVKSNLARVPECWSTNADFLSMLLDTTDLEITTSLCDIEPTQDEDWELEQEQHGHNDGHNEQETREEQSSSDGTPHHLEFTSYETLFQLVLHVRRDWTEAGAGLREKLYGGMVRELHRFSKWTALRENEGEEEQRAERRMSVLVPGAGLGRLALEIAHAFNASVDCHESSMPFVLAARNIFKHISMPPATDGADGTEKHDANSHQFYPLLHLPYTDEWNFHRVTPDTFPDNGAAVRARRRGESGFVSFRLADSANFIAQSGPHSKNSYDVVATSFFIDTGNPVKNIASFAHVLKEGGIWVNAGPLHYHRPSIPLSHKEVHALAEALGFELLHEEVIESDYAAESVMTMKPEFYRHPLTVWRLGRPASAVDLLALMNIPPPSPSMGPEHETKSTAEDAGWYSPNFKLA